MEKWLKTKTDAIFFSLVSKTNAVKVFSQTLKNKKSLPLEETKVTNFKADVKIRASLLLFFVTNFRESFFLNRCETFSFSNLHHE